jgi:uncharacterized protein (TIGR03000 family)
VAARYVAPARSSSTSNGASSLAALPQSAKLVVELPKDAKLYVDDQPLKSASAKRVFRTPELQPGLSYYYMLRAEVVRDGKAVSKEQRVIVRAGDETRASFADLETPASAQVASSANR